MGYVNLPPSLQAIFADLDARLNKVENAQRFTMPNTPVLTSQPTITGGTTGDPSNPRVGDIWLNTTTNTPKYVNTSGVVTNLVTAASTPVPYGPRYVKTGYFYAPIGLVTQGSGTTFTADLAHAVPFYCPQTITAIYLSINVTSLNRASGGVRVGIYSNSTTDDYPNARLADGGVIGTDTVGGSTGPNLAIISVSLTPGLYWLVGVRQGVSNPGLYSYTTTNGVMSEVIPTGILSSSSYGAVAWTQSGVSGALPATWTTTKTLSLTAPAISIGF